MKKTIEYIDGKKIESIIFFEDDLKLLSQKIDLSPCQTKCAHLNSVEKNTCCGCPERIKWEQDIKPYKERGLLKYALTLTKLREICHKYGPESYPYKEAIQKLPNQLRKFI